MSAGGSRREGARAGCVATLTFFSGGPSRHPVCPPPTGAASFSKTLLLLGRSGSRSTLATEALRASATRPKRTFPRHRRYSRRSACTPQLRPPPSFSAADGPPHRPGFCSAAGPYDASVFLPQSGFSASDGPSRQRRAHARCASAIPTAGESSASFSLADEPCPLQLLRTASCAPSLPQSWLAASGRMRRWSLSRSTKEDAPHQAVA